jgi:hypothetical protein
MLLGILFSLNAQETAQGGGGPGGQYLIPQTVFVGDRGRLVAPLGPDFAGLEPFTAENSGQLPGLPDLVIRRIEVERRGEERRLLIDFVAYAPGKFSLPPVSLPPGGTLRLTGLELTIASILSPPSMILAEPAPPLALPGTSLLIGGGLLLAALILFAAIGGSVRGRSFFAVLLENGRKRFLLRSMERILRRLRAEALRERAAPAVGEILARFSAEMRNGISLFDRRDYRAWTAGELSVPFPVLALLFRRSDTLRFSGAGVERGELLAILDETRLFLGTLLRPPVSEGGPQEAPPGRPHEL